MKKCLAIKVATITIISMTLLELMKFVHVSISWARHCGSQAGGAPWVHVLQLRKQLQRDDVTGTELEFILHHPVEFFELGTLACVAGLQ